MRQKLLMVCVLAASVASQAQKALIRNPSTLLKILFRFDMMLCPKLIPGTFNRLPVSEGLIGYGIS